MDIFSGLALVLGLAALGGVIAKLLKQPALLGYVAAGACISYFDLAAHGSTKSMVDAMGQLGVTLLLFLVGLELPISELKRMGKVALATGIGQIVFTAGIGYFLIQLLGFSSVTSLYLSIALAFSSTIIIVKLLSEKKDLNTLYGKIAVGFLLVQDFVAIGLLVVLSGFAQGSFGVTSLVSVVVKAVVMVGVALWLSTHLLPKVLSKISSSGEILFICTLAWCLGIAAIVASPVVGFGLEIGGFVAGLALANAASHLQIVSRVRPLRDFFLTLFFVSLGANIHLGDLQGTLVAVAILSVFILIGNPLIVMAIMGYMGYKKRTSFMAGVTVAQISEFSLIVVAMAVRIGHVPNQVLAFTALIGIITMTLSTYMILYADKIFNLISPWLTMFERRKTNETSLATSSTFTKHIVLFGHNRTGAVLRPALEKLSKQVLVVDFNPTTIEKLTKDEVASVFGDMSDPELYEQINLDQAEMIVSTVSDQRDSLLLLEYASALKTKPVVIVSAQDSDEALRLYSAGADYVLVPTTVGGEYLAHVFNHHGLDRKYIKEHGELHRTKIAKVLPV